MKPKRCDQCEALVINGLFCHEFGCPNRNKLWIGGEWVRSRICRDCGEQVPVDDPCCAVVDEEAA